ncbi:MAG: glycosyltransferase, partial [Akkermansiaceae bacterium]
RVSLVNSLAAIATHPALAGVYVGNEVPADLARWMGPVKVRLAIEDLISLGREIAPHLMFAYANYPSTEYLEPENADFTAFNVYLEDESAFRSYLKRLHHIAGDRPLVISEFGLDSRRNGLEKQALTLRWGLQATRDLETAGTTIYAWSDRWWNASAEVLDWDFGLLDRDDHAKPALTAVVHLNTLLPDCHPSVSVIVCTRNGTSRIGDCLRAIGKLAGGGMETIVVDDGSEDGTAEYVAQNFPWARLLVLEPSGLSAARNAGAEAALSEILAFTDDDCEPDAEWITRIRPVFQDGRYAAACGPNLAPGPRTWEEAVVGAAPGAPSHVMLDDEEAEHLPGCNLVVRKSAFDAIGGFDPQFHTAGDDVDFCWRLRDAGYRLGFVPGAFVWHWRRPSICTFLRQQIGYGRAEHLLMAKHPARFSKSGDAKWQGFIYGGGPVRVMDDSIIYHGPMGNAGYQAIMNRMLPLRGLNEKFRTPQAKLALAFVNFIQPQLRGWARNHRFRIQRKARPKRIIDPTEEFQIHCADGSGREHYLNLL